MLVNGEHRIGIYACAYNLAFYFFQIHPKKNIYSFSQQQKSWKVKNYSSTTVLVFFLLLPTRKKRKRNRKRHPNPLCLLAYILNIPRTLVILKNRIYRLAIDIHYFLSRYITLYKTVQLFSTVENPMSIHALICSPYFMMQYNPLYRSHF